jgi:hypothetical protein
MASICEEAGFPVVFVATDGDSGMDERHRATAALIRELLVLTETNQEPCRVFLERILADLWRQDPLVFCLWPVSDLLHLLKNVPTRLAAHLLMWRSDRDAFDGAYLNAVFAAAGLGEFPGQGADLATMKRQDGPAIAVVMPQVLQQLLRLNQEYAARWLAPWTFLDLAVASTTLDVQSRLVLSRPRSCSSLWLTNTSPTTFPKALQRDPCPRPTRGTIQSRYESVRRALPRDYQVS